MLVLSRKLNERIVIGQDLIQVVVVDIRGDKVRLGVDGPRAIEVHRHEVYQAILRERLAAGDAIDPTATGSIFTNRELLIEFADPRALQEAFASGITQFQIRRAA